jgi:replicative DNA helicase
MSKEQLVLRMLGSEGMIPFQDMRSGTLSKADWPQLTTAAAHLSNAPLYIDDTPISSPMDLRIKCRRLKREHGLDLIIIDYLQMMRSDNRLENRQQEISAISRGLKALAKEMSVPVIAAAQLSRAVESRKDHRPQLADLRESGAIEQDADLVAFVFRPEVYGILQDDLGNDMDGVAELIIAKQRNGPTGTIKLAFLKECTRFQNLDQAHGKSQFAPET